VQRGNGGTISLGSGTVVRVKGEWSYVLTCKHAIPDSTLPITVLSGRQWYPAEFVKADGIADLALVKVRAKLAVAPVAAADPPVGSQLWQQGCKDGGPPLVRTGPLRLAAPSTWEIDMESFPGQSGAGVFHGTALVAVYWGRVVSKDRHGNVVQAGASLAVAGSDVRRFLKGE
jgi:hypothetical protein